MSAILPPGVSVMLVRYAIACEREARDFRRYNLHGHAVAAERRAAEARDAVAAHDEAQAARLAGMEPRPVDLRGVFPEANLEGAA